MTRMRSSAAAQVLSPEREPPDPFRFGWRYERVPGSSECVQRPLTLDEVLHPQEGDHIPQNTQQGHDRTYLVMALRYRLANHPHSLVLSDCLVNWGVKGLRNHSPDIVVFKDVAEPDKNRKTFRVRKEGARPLLVIEIVSPDAHDRQARDNDVVAKVKEYYRAGVPLYVIIDQEKEDGPRQLLGYHPGQKEYERLPLDGQGRLLLEPVGLLLGLRDERAVLFDAATGEAIGDLTAMARARDAEAATRRAVEAALAEAHARIRELEAPAAGGKKDAAR